MLRDQIFWVLLIFALVGINKEWLRPGVTSWEDLPSQREVIITVLVFDLWLCLFLIWEKLNQPRPVEQP